jgi:creatinine amidohydrolase
VLTGFWLGMSEHHLPFGGTISLDFRSYHGIFNCIVRSLKVLGFSRILVVNGHGGNVDPLKVIVRELAVAYDMPIVATTPWYLAPQETMAIFDSNPEGRHACEGETSIMLATSADTVRRDEFDTAMRLRPPGVLLRAGFYRFYSFSEVAPIASITGDPRTATAEKGEKFSYDSGSRTRRWNPRRSLMDPSRSSLEARSSAANNNQRSKPGVNSRNSLPASQTSASHLFSRRMQRSSLPMQA